MVSVVGIILALGYAAARVLFNDRIIDQGDLEALGIIPVLGTVPQLPRETERGSKKIKVTRDRDG
jgi:capsular polysaccharide biosynthesis protein